MFDVGKYKMRSGRDAEVVAVRGDIAIGFIDDDPELLQSWLAKTGAYHFDNSGESIFDLIHPDAKKPIKLERWLTIYYNDSNSSFVGGTYVSLDEAKQNKQCDCIAIAKVEIDCMEGDNLD